MPFKTEWVDNEIALTYKGVSIYHLYNDDIYENGTLEYWFTLNADAEFGEATFDVREIAKVLPLEDKEYSIEEILKLGVDHGIIPQEGINIKDE